MSKKNMHNSPEDVGIDEIPTLKEYRKGNNKKALRISLRRYIWIFILV